MSQFETEEIKPWYRQPWAWFILTPLITVVISCSVMVSIAFKHADDVVIDNYYKEGRMINQRLDEDVAAKALGIKGQLKVDGEVGELLLTISSNKPLAQNMLVYFDHPLETDLDQKFVLTEVAPGYYRADIESRLQYRWYIRIEPKVMDESLRWRVVGELNLSNSDKVTFGQND